MCLSSLSELRFYIDSTLGFDVFFKFIRSKGIAAPIHSAVESILYADATNFGVQRAPILEINESTSLQTALLFCVVIAIYFDRYERIPIFNY